MSDTMQSITAIIAAVIGLAIVAVIVSKNANTSGVLGSAGTALSQVIGAAVAPVSGGSSVASSVSNPFSLLSSANTPLMYA